METNTPKPSSRPVISPLAPEMQNQSAAVWQLYTNSNTTQEVTIGIPESGVLSIIYQVDNGDAAGVSVQVWLPTASEILEQGKLYHFPVEPGAIISLTYSQEYDQVNLQYFVAPN